MTRQEYNKGFCARNFEMVSLDPLPAVDLDNHNPLLDLIFAKDERGCYVGDIALFEGQNTNPQVRQFIEQQLMIPNSQDGGLTVGDDVANKFRNLSDDDVANFSRNHGESQEQYAYRIGKFLSEERAKNVANARYKREKERLESLGYNFD